MIITATLIGTLAIGAVLCHALYQIIENDWMDHDE